MLKNDGRKRQANMHSQSSEITVRRFAPSFIYGGEVQVVRHYYRSLVGVMSVLVQRHH